MKEKINAILKNRAQNKGKFTGFIFPTIITFLFLFPYYYFALPAINLRSGGVWIFIILTALVFIVSYVSWNNSTFIKDAIEWLRSVFKEDTQKNVKSKKTRPGDYIVNNKSYHRISISRGVKITLIVLGAIIAVVILACIFTSTRVFRAKAYQEMLDVTESDFLEDIAEMSISQIPIVDRDTAERLGSRKIGEVVELVSQFNVSSYYSQINYDDKPYRVSPLEYADILKWMSNKDDGIPYYISIDMATQESELVKLSEGMKYSPSEYFERDLKRHIRFAYPTKMFENLSFEIDDNAHPYWVMSYYTYTIGIVGGKDIAGIILVDAVTGEMQDYSVENIPQWIDLAYSPELVVEQANNWGSLKSGFFNSLFVQKGVVATTEGYNYIAVDDDVWLYTGITSVVADESNIGFILINMRTKEAKTYMINGAEEYSAMRSAEGEIQEKGYTATFPILLNVADRPTYFISLKDNEGLVKAYAFVSVADYQIVGVADKIADANAEYLRKLGIEAPSDDDIGDTDDFSGEIIEIATAVKNGNTLYYLIIKDESGESKIYTADIRISDILPFLKAGDIVDFVADADGKIGSIKK